MIMPQLNLINGFRFLAKMFQTKSGRGRTWPKYLFLVSENISLEYNYALVAII